MKKIMFNNYSVIFDMDGVLADTGPIHYESWVKLATQIGCSFSKEFFDKTFGQQSPTIVKKLIGSDVQERDVKRWAKLKEQYYRDMVKDKLQPLPGVIELIDDLKKNKFKLAVGSSGPKENVNLLLKKLKIEKKFDVVISAADVIRGKPEPDVFLIAAESIKIKPENCVVIEDAPVGIEAAKKANMKTIALTTTHDRTKLLTADLIVKDLSYIKLEDILRLLNVKDE